MQEDLIARLIADAPLAALVGSRINWVRRPQASALPAVVLQTISNVPSYTFDGETNFSDARVQVDCFALTYASARAVAQAVSSSLSGYRGTVGATAFQGVFKVSDRDMQEPGEASEDRIYRVMLEFMVTWRNA